MSSTPTCDEELIAELVQRRAQAFSRWRELVRARAEHFALVPAAIAESAAERQLIDDAERAYRQLDEQLHEVQSRVAGGRHS